MANAIVAEVQSPGTYSTPGNRRVKMFDFTFSSSYPTNGEPMTASLFGLTLVDAVIPCGTSPRASAALVPCFDRAHGTLRLYTASTGAEVSGDQSSNLVTILVYGI